MPSDNNQLSASITALHPLSSDVVYAISIANNSISNNNSYMSDHRYIEMQREINRLSREIESLKKALIETENNNQNETAKNFRKIKV